MQSIQLTLLTKLSVASLILLVMTTLPLHFSVIAKSSGNSNNNNDNNNGLNVIFGTRSYTKGTSHDDTIIACPSIAPGTQGTVCSFGDTLRGLEGNDVLQGSNAPDHLYGDEGADTITGAAGDDTLYGGPGADFFDCGDGQDTVIDFNPTQGDTHADNCEVILTHNSHDIDFMVQHGVDRSNDQALGSGSFKHDTSISELGKNIK